MAKQFILFDPVTAERKIVTYKSLSGITGRSVDSLKSTKRHRSRMRGLGWYILEVDTDINVYRELMDREIIVDEEWREIPDSSWKVSSYGRYKSMDIYTGKELFRLPKYCKNKRWFEIGIRCGGERRRMSAHAKVVELFIGEVPEGHIIYHKNGDPVDNRVENLGFITRKEIVKKQLIPANVKPVVQIDEITGEVVAEYKSLKEAAKANHTHQKNIYLALKGNRPSLGFIWLTEEMALERGIYEQC